MPRRLSSLQARAICHATEDEAKVEQALRLIVGDAPLRTSRADGHHGNPIMTLEATVEDEGEIIAVLARFDAGDLREVRSTADSRMDRSCTLHVRVDKQAAYEGRLRLAREGDVISLRVKLRAFPAKPEVACDIIRDIIEGIVSSGPKLGPERGGP